VHRDFHSGNIVVDKEIDENKNEHLVFRITDLGLSRPANSQSEAGKIFGVMPYVAPEVLQGESYTQASDVYSFGIIMYEMITSLSPYYDRKHDTSLALDICRGLRPQFQIKIPPLLEDLIKQC